eukprot:520458-Prymnesium_polylepis.1
MPLKAVFSDLDGTLVHFAKWFEQHGTRIVSMDEQAGTAVVETASGERRDCRLLPSSTMGPGLVSERSVELVAELRAEGVMFVVVTAARKSTLLERLPLLPDCDAAVAETGSRVYLGGGAPVQHAAQLSAQLDTAWSARLEPYCGPIEREMDPADRPEPLWELARRLQQQQGLKVDTRSYYGCFRGVHRPNPLPGPLRPITPPPSPTASLAAALPHPQPNRRLARRRPPPPCARSPPPHRSPCGRHV